MKALKTSLTLLVAFALVSLNGGLAVAGENSQNPDPSLAAKIAGIGQLVADYVQDVDWGPLSDAPNGVNDTETIGDLFTPNGNFAVGYWNSGNPVPLSWHPARVLAMTSATISVLTLSRVFSGVRVCCRAGLWPLIT
jgi:hypothetical protein